MYSSYLSTHRCIRVLHCSKQCYNSSTPRPFNSCAILPSSLQLMANGFPSVHFSLWCTEKSLLLLPSALWSSKNLGFLYNNCPLFSIQSLLSPPSNLQLLRKKSQGAKSVNMKDVKVFELVYWEETSREKGRCELGHCPDAASRRCSSRDSAPSSASFVALSLC